MKNLMRRTLALFTASALMLSSFPAGTLAQRVPDCPGCNAEGRGTQVTVPGQSVIDEVVQKAGPSCKVTPSPGACMAKQFQCVDKLLTRNPAQLASTVAEFSQGKGVTGFLDTCFGPTAGCVKDVFVTFAKYGLTELIAMPGQLWELGKSAVKLPFKAIKNWNDTRNIENNQSYRANAIANIDRETLMQNIAKKNRESARSANRKSGSTQYKPTKFEAFATAFMNGFDHLMQERFLCEEWEGNTWTQGYKAKCVKPAESWQCASCTDKVSGVCAMMGAGAGIIFGPAFYVGGVAGMLKAANNLRGAKLAIFAVRGAEISANTAKAVKGSRAVQAVARTRAGQRTAQAAAAAKQRVTNFMAVRQAQKTYAAQRIPEIMKSYEAAGKTVAANFRASVQAKREFQTAKKLEAAAKAAGSGRTVQVSEASRIRLVATEAGSRGVSGLMRALDQMDMMGFRTGARAEGLIARAANARGIDYAARSAAAKYELANRLARSSLFGNQVANTAQAARGLAAIDADNVSDVLRTEISSAVPAVSPERMDSGTNVFLSDQFPTAARRAEDSAGDIKYGLENGKQVSELEGAQDVRHLDTDVDCR